MQNKIIRIMSIILAAVIIITSGAALSASEVSEISYGQGSGDYEGACDIREDNDLDAEDELLYEDTDEDTDDDNDEDVSEDVNENIDEEYSDIDEIFDDGQVEDQYAAEEIFLDEEGDDQYAAEDMEPDTGDAEDTELYSDEGSEDLNISGIISGNDNRQEQITDGDLTDRDVPEDPEGEYETQEINNEAGPEGRYESDDNEIFAGNDLPDDFSDMDLTSGYEKEAESGIFSDKETESAPEGKSENEAESEIQTGSAPDQGDEPEKEEDTDEITYDDNDNDTSVDLYFIDEGFDYSQYYYLNLSSMRLIVGSYDENIFYGDEHLISSYEGMHLLQFEDEETTLRAYAYYTLMADFAEVDSGIMIAEGEAADVIDTDTVMTEEENPLSELEEAVREADVWTVYDIALIDTGADTANGAVSMIGEYTGDDNGHGTAMLNYIREYAPEARVLSVKALGADGKGDVSAVYAAIMYALERGVKVINLSISALAGGDSTVIEQAVNNAAAQGIIVVGSAGNNGRSAKWYVPGKIYSAVIAGACDGEGRILNTSNFGDTVDYLVAADSTSEAAARLSGIICSVGYDGVEEMLNRGVVFTVNNDGLIDSAPDDEDGEFVITKLPDDYTGGTVAASLPVMEDYISSNYPGASINAILRGNVDVSISPSFPTAYLMTSYDPVWAVPYDSVNAGTAAVTITSRTTGYKMVLTLKSITDQYRRKYADKPHALLISQTTGSLIIGGASDAAGGDQTIWGCGSIGSTLSDEDTDPAPQIRVKFNTKLYDGDGNICSLPNIYVGYVDVDRGGMVQNNSSLIDEWFRSAAGLDSGSGQATFANTNNGMVYCTSEQNSNGGAVYNRTDRLNRSSGVNMTFGWSGNQRMRMVVYTLTYPVRYQASTGGSITGQTSEDAYMDGYATGSTAAANSGYKFNDRWTANADVTLKNGTAVRAGSSLTTAQLKQVKVTDPITFTAYFDPIYTVQYKALSGGSITGRTSESVDTGKNPAGSAAAPDTGYKFVKWTADKAVTLTNGTVISGGSAITDAQIKQVAVTSDLVFTADFDPVVYTVTLDSQGADTTGTPAYYEWYGIGNYAQKTCAATITDITNPVKAGNVFQGYFTEKNGKGTQYVTSAGKITSGPVTFSTDTTLYACWTELGRLDFTKESAAPEITGSNPNYSLEGARYGIYTDSACTKLYKEAVTDTQGKFSLNNIPYGKYYIKELEPSQGFGLADCGKNSADIHAIEFTSVSTQVSVTCKEPVNAALITAVVQKVDSRSGSIVPQAAAVFYGAEYTVNYYTSSDWSGKPDRIWTFVTDAAGRAYLSADYLADGSDSLYITPDKTAVIPVGSFTLQETKAPEGYTLDETVYSFKVYGDEDDKNSAPGINALITTPALNINKTEDAIYGGVRMKKTDAAKNSAEGQGDASIEGAKIGIFNNSENPVWYDGADHAKGELIMTIITDEEGIAQTQPDALPCGSYILREIEPSEGYRLNEEWSVEFGIGKTPEDNGVIVDVTDQPLLQEPVRGGVSFLKVDSETLQPEARKQGTLAGAQISIYNISAADVLMEDTWYAPEQDVSAEGLRSSGTPVMTVTTDENGFASTQKDSLPYGTYAAIETKNSYFYRLNAQWIVIFRIREDGSIINTASIDDYIGSFENTAEDNDGSVQDDNSENTGQETGETETDTLGNVVLTEETEDGAGPDADILQIPGKGGWTAKTTGLGLDDAVQTGVLPEYLDRPDDAPGYTMAKKLISETPLRRGDTARYEVTVTNLGGLDLEMTVSDRFDEEIAQYFNDLRITDIALGENSFESAERTQTSARIRIGAGETAVISYSATVADNAPELSEQSASGGYRNIASTSDVEGIWYTKEGEEQRIDPETDDGAYSDELSGREDDAYTPVEVLRPHYTFSKERLTIAGENGFREGDTVQYLVTVKNDGGMDLEMTVSDTFDEEATQAFSNLEITNVELGSDSSGICDQTDTDVRIRLAKGDTALITYSAVVAAQAQDSSPEDIFDGCRNIARAADVEGIYPTNEDIEKRITPEDNEGEFAQELSDSEDEAITPIGVPEPHYILTKTRVTDAHKKPGTDSYGFSAGDVVEYNVSVINDGGVDLEMEISDIFDEKAAQYFSDPEITNIEGTELKRINQGTSLIEIKAGEQAVVSYEAEVLNGIPELLAGSEKDNGTGYRNIAFSDNVIAKWTSNNGDEIRVLSEDSADHFGQALEKQEDYAYTSAADPVILKNPDPAYHIENIRITEASPDAKGKGYGFLYDETVTFRAEAVNDGDVDLEMIVSLIPGEKAQKALKVLKILGVQGEEIQRLSSDSALIALPVGQKAVITYQAVVMSGAQQNLSQSAKDDGNGYEMTARAMEATGRYTDTDGKTKTITEKDTKELKSKSASAYTPVRLAAPVTIEPEQNNNKEPVPVNNPDTPVPKTQETVQTGDLNDTGKYLMLIIASLAVICAVMAVFVSRMNRRYVDK